MKRIALLIIFLVAAVTPIATAQDATLYHIARGKMDIQWQMPDAHTLWIAVKFANPANIDAYRIAGEVVLQDGRAVPFDTYVTRESFELYSGRFLTFEGCKIKLLSHVTVTPHTAGESIEIWPA
jgi:hypothetical protein